MNILLSIYTSRGDIANVILSKKLTRKVILTHCDPEGIYGPVGPISCQRLRIVHCGYKPIDLYIDPNPSDEPTVTKVDLLAPCSPDGTVGSWPYGSWSFPKDNPVDLLNKLTEIIWGKI